MKKRTHRRSARGLTAALLCFAATAVGSVGTGGPSASAVSSPCLRHAQPPSYQHVIWILMENKTYSDVIGNPAAPYINSLATQCALAHVQAAAHPSLPNYIALTSGSTHGIHDDKDPSAHPLSGPSIFSQLNGNWHSYAESMPHACTLTNAGKYAVRHVPATYYTNVRSLCMTHVLPYSGVPSLSSAFTMITPNLTHDMHSGSSLQQEIKNGDKYLAGFLPNLFAKSPYTAGRTVVIITWDEGRGSNNVVPGIVISPSVGPANLGTMRDADVLHFTENLLGLPPL
jgi:hypothetical protein